MMKKSAWRSFITRTVALGLITVSATCAQASETTLQRIQREGVLHVATEPAFEPYEFMQDGQIVGYGTDILHEVALRLGVTLDQLDLPFNAILPGLMAHKFDLAATTLIATPERAKKVAFTAPISEGQEVILVRADVDGIHDKYGFIGKSVGAQQNAYMAAEYKKLNEAFKAEHKGTIKTTAEFQSFPEMKLALINHQIDAVVLPLPMAATWIKSSPGKMKISGLWTPETTTNNDSVWAVRLEDNTLRTFINDTLADMQKSGELAKLQVKWFGNSLDALKQQALSAGH